jgi:type II secretory pathway pseudopilin PulG
VVLSKRIVSDFVVRDRSLRRGRSRQAPAAGFGLLEAVVALLVATIALGTLFAAVSDALRIDTVATRTMQAVVRARSHLAMALADEMPVPGEHEGDDGGGFRWHVQCETLATDPAADNKPAATLYSVSVRITWERDGGTSEVRLDSEHLGRP